MRNDQVMAKVTELSRMRASDVSLVIFPSDSELATPDYVYSSVLDDYVARSTQRKDAKDACNSDETQDKAGCLADIESNTKEIVYIEYAKKYQYTRQ